jgi:hypothetical protein
LIFVSPGAILATSPRPFLLLFFVFSKVLIIFAPQPPNGIEMKYFQNTRKGLIVPGRLQGRVTALFYFLFFRINFIQFFGKHFVELAKVSLVEKRRGYVYSYIFVVGGSVGSPWEYADYFHFSSF